MHSPNSRGRPRLSAVHGRLVLLMFAAWHLQSADARFFLARMPNGGNVPCLGQAGCHGQPTCESFGHDDCFPGRPLNAFAHLYKLDPTGLWTVDKCATDSDGDGYTNGDELGDPCCRWQSGSPPTHTTGISDPASAVSTPSRASCSSVEALAAPFLLHSLSAEGLQLVVAPTNATVVCTCEFAVRIVDDESGDVREYRTTEQSLLYCPHPTHGRNVTVALAGVNRAGVGPFSPPLRFTTADAPPCGVAPVATLAATTASSASGTVASISSAAMRMLTSRSSALSAAPSMSGFNFTDGASVIDSAGAVSLAQVPLVDGVGVAMGLWTALLAAGAVLAYLKDPMSTVRAWMLHGAPCRTRPTHLALRYLFGDILLASPATVLVFTACVAGIGVTLAFSWAWFDKELFSWGQGFPVHRAAGFALSVSLGLQLLPVTRNSLWLHLFRVPFERALVLHRWLGAVTLLLTLWHGVAMCVSFNGTGLGWRYAFLWSPLDAINPLPGALAGILIVLISCLAIEPIRRRWYEVTLVVHRMWPLVIVFSCLHTWGSKGYALPILLPGTLLIGLDYCALACDALLRPVTVLRMGYISDKPEDPKWHRTAYLECYKGSGAQWLNALWPFNYTPGQYLYLAIPGVSLWPHPISISSPQSNLSPGVFTVHIKSMGPGTWSDGVVALAMATVHPRGDSPNNLSQLNTARQSDTHNQSNASSVCVPVQASASATAHRHYSTNVSSNNSGRSSSTVHGGFGFGGLSIGRHLASAARTPLSRTRKDTKDTALEGTGDSSRVIRNPLQTIREQSALAAETAGTHPGASDDAEDTEDAGSGYNHVAATPAPASGTSRKSGYAGATTGGSSAVSLSGAVSVVQRAAPTPFAVPPREATATCHNSGNSSFLGAAARSLVSMVACGPFGRLSLQADRYKHFILVAGGIGITPLAPIHFALARGLPLSTGGGGSCHRCDTLTTIWTTRDRALLAAFTPVLGTEEDQVECNRDGGGLHSATSTSVHTAVGSGIPPASRSTGGADFASSGSLPSRVNGATGLSGDLTATPPRETVNVLAMGSQLAAARKWVSSFSIFGNMVVETATSRTLIQLNVYLTSGRARSSATGANRAAANTFRSVSGAATSTNCSASPATAGVPSDAVNNSESIATCSTGTAPSIPRTLLDGTASTAPSGVFRNPMAGTATEADGPSVSSTDVPVCGLPDVAPPREGIISESFRNLFAQAPDSIAGADVIDDTTAAVLAQVNAIPNVAVPVVNKERPHIPSLLESVGKSLDASHGTYELIRAARAGAGTSSTASSAACGACAVGSLVQRLWRRRSCRRSRTDASPVTGHSSDIHTQATQASQSTRGASGPASSGEPDPRSAVDGTGRLAVAVLVCGPPAMVLDTVAACAELNAGPLGKRLVFHVHQEKFLF